MIRRLAQAIQRPQKFRDGTVNRSLAVMLVGCMVFGLGCDNASPPSNADREALINAKGRALYTTAHPTAGGGSISCAECHGPDGTGGPAPTIQGEAPDHLLTHAQGGGTHPEGIKYPDLTVEDFDAIAFFLGAEESEDPDHNGDHEPLVGDPVSGQQLFTANQETTDVGPIACATCHADDGSSGFGPDIRGEEADHLEAHAQGGGRHPAGVKFPELTAQDFADMAAFLAGLSDDEHSDEDEHDHAEDDGHDPTEEDGHDHAE